MRFLILFLLISACTTATKQVKQEAVIEKKEKITDCINESNKDVIIRWGTRLKSANLHYGYCLNSDGEVFKYTSQSKKEFRINNISQELLCEVMIETQKEFIKVGALNVPADTTVFVFYENPKQKSTLRAMWNPKTPAIGSEGMREVLNLLIQCYPENRILLHEEDR